jgi:putative transposase
MPFIREKPHRLSRDHYRGPVTVSFTLCIDSFKKPFADADVVAAFVPLLAKAVEKSKCIVPIYCFMPDHLHVMLLGQANEADLWRAIVDFKQSSGYWFGQKRREFQWQKDFHDHIIRGVAERAVRIRYIADNPVRRHLAVVWSEYPFTGAIGVEFRQVMADVATE